MVLVWKEPGAKARADWAWIQGPEGPCYLRVVAGLARRRLV